MCNPFSRTDHLSRRYKDLHTVARLFRKIRFDWSERDADASFGGADAVAAARNGSCLAFSYPFPVSAGSLICCDTRLALEVGVFRIGEPVARKRDEHGRVLAVAAILVAELLDQIVLF